MLTRWLCLVGVMSCLALDANAQIARSPTPPGDATTLPVPSARRPDFPLAGLWRGARILPPGTDTVTLLFGVEGQRYTGAMVYPRGLVVPHDKVTSADKRLVWEQRNSGGGMWVYDVKLVSRDRLEGTVTLRDAPTNLQPAPTGTIALVRQLPSNRP